jgi:hypothetical protein
MLSGQGAAEEITRQEAEALMSECQSQRQQHIAPQKEKAIDDCINKQRRDKEYCERFNRNFGQRAAGGTRRGLFWGLPVCEKAVEAERYFLMNPRMNTYSFNND